MADSASRADSASKASSAGEAGTARADTDRAGRVDGRRAKGERRRQAIIEATLRVIERDGVAGVTHRSVAREAGVPTTATTYYFASLDELLTATLTWSADALATEITGLISRALATGDSGAGDAAELLAAAVGRNRGRSLAEYELYLLAARRPELRPAARRWINVLAETLGPHSDDPVALRALLAAVDGLVLQGLIADEPPTAESIRPVLSYLIRPAEHLAAAQARRTRRTGPPGGADQAGSSRQEDTSAEPSTGQSGPVA
ncbi:transcriptional regulator, TetR family [Goodfellowiella coeruleoviolacea]|uniref:Transcriptional regulator, TetR family n=1 Tax=Goodfellowiella coeruleoviolacea TaxID=334858 RepID=A0AAE3GFD1_9PSEU|nr:transcriptional regulator, TetR family [Goodfellowiella coeruleoviolacea]